MLPGRFKGDDERFVGHGCSVFFSFVQLLQGGRRGDRLGFNQDQHTLRKEVKNLYKKLIHNSLSYEEINLFLIK